MAKIPYFPFYPDDWISSPKVLMMTMEQRGIYISLLAHAWNFPGGALPADMPMLQRFCHGARRKNIEIVLDMCFIRRGHEGGGEAWMNPRLLHERSKALVKQDKASESAKCMWNKRKQDANASETQSECNANQNQNQNQNHITPKSTVDRSKKRFAPPSLQEVNDYCVQRGNKVDPQQWMDHYTANGWRVGKNPMKDWRAAVRSWEHREAKGGPSNGSGRGAGGAKSFKQQERERLERVKAETDRILGLRPRSAGVFGGDHPADDRQPGAAGDMAGEVVIDAEVEAAEDR